MLNAKRTGKVLIPDSVLKALAASGLPPEKHAYDRKLRELDSAAEKSCLPASFSTVERPAALGEQRYETQSPGIV
jgi:hypothetical protein